MKRALLTLILFGVLLNTSGCGGVRIFISERRLRGTVTDEDVVAVSAVEEATPEASSDAAAIIRDLEDRVGDDLVAQSTFSGRETPNSRPVRDARVEPGDTIRISSSRAQQVVQIAEEHCQEAGTRCSNIWVYGRLRGGTVGAWYPLIIFDYDFPE
ncbi:MAG: hypothetical protein M3220_07665 [Chloroflexota bacterium]|nr:hypothetical protein [Chloroflexota bacterium]